MPKCWESWNCRRRRVVENTDFWRQIQEGLLDNIDVTINLVADGQAQDIHQFFCGRLCLTSWEAHNENLQRTKRRARLFEFVATGKSKLNHAVTNAQRLIEQAFGRLKIRWVVCARNLFFEVPEFVKLCICVYCAVHKFFEMRNVEFHFNELTERLEYI
jgi:hypothetical protein